VPVTNTSKEFPASVVRVKSSKNGEAGMSKYGYRYTALQSSHPPQSAPYPSQNRSRHTTVAVTPPQSALINLLSRELKYIWLITNRKKKTKICNFRFYWLSFAGFCHRVISVVFHFTKYWGMIYWWRLAPQAGGTRNIKQRGTIPASQQCN
jgi:hypothetical protein